MICNGLIHWSSVLTIMLMAAATYLTRIVGFLALRNRPRWRSPCWPPRGCRCCRRC